MRNKFKPITVFIIAIVVVFTLSTGLAFAEENSVTLISKGDMSKGYFGDTYRVTLDIENGYHTAVVEHLADGTTKATYYKDDEVVVFGDEVFTGPDKSATKASGTKTVTGTGTLKQGSVIYNKLVSKLTYNYNGSQVTSVSKTNTISCVTPWTKDSNIYVNTSTIPAPSVLMGVTQNFKTSSGVIYKNTLNNYIRGYANGSSSVTGTYTVDSRLIGWSFAFNIS